MALSEPTDRDYSCVLARPPDRDRITRPQLCGVLGARHQISESSSSAPSMSYAFGFAGRSMPPWPRSEYAQTRPIARRSTARVARFGGEDGPFLPSSTSDPERCASTRCRADVSTARLHRVIRLTAREAPHPRQARARHGAAIRRRTSGARACDIDNVEQGGLSSALAVVTGLPAQPRQVNLSSPGSTSTAGSALNVSSRRAPRRSLSASRIAWKSSSWAMLRMVESSADSKSRLSRRANRTTSLTSFRLVVPSGDLRCEEPEFSPSCASRLPSCTTARRGARTARTAD